MKKTIAIIIALATLPACASIDKNYVMTDADKCDQHLNFVATNIEGAAVNCLNVWHAEKQNAKRAEIKRMYGWPK